MCISFPHVDDAIQPQHGPSGRRSHTVLAGAGLGDHPGGPDPLGQQRLSDGVVDLMGSGVIQVLPFQIDAGATQFTAQALRKVERAGPSYIFLENLIQFLVEVGVILVALKCFIANLSLTVSDSFNFTTNKPKENAFTLSLHKLCSILQWY